VIERNRISLLSDLESCNLHLRQVSRSPNLKAYDEEDASWVGSGFEDSWTWWEYLRDVVLEIVYSIITDSMGLNGVVYREI